MVGIHLLGPLPETNDGDKYIIVAVDYFTKWAIKNALPTTVHVVQHLCKRDFFDGRFEMRP